MKGESCPKAPTESFLHGMWPQGEFHILATVLVAVPQERHNK